MATLYQIFIFNFKVFLLRIWLHLCPENFTVNPACPHALNGTVLQKLCTGTARLGYD